MSEKYKIMLVDDEEEVRLSIQKKIKWADLGFELVGDAENGEDGLEKAEILKPDVVLTDIRMPYVDGLTMSMKLKELNPAIRIIIFSGYDDFEYAKQAISLNVIEYILKPVNVEELTEILTRVKETLDKEMDMRRDMAALRKNQIQSLPILREQFLNQLVRGRLSSKELENVNWELYDLKIDPEKVFTVAVLQFQAEKRGEEFTPFQKDWELIPLAVQNIAEERLQLWGEYYGFWNSGYFVVLAPISDEQTMESFLRCLNEICKLCRHFLHLNVTVGVGTPVKGYSHLRIPYTQAKAALTYGSPEDETSQVLYISDVEPESRKVTHLRLSDAAEAQLLSTLKVGSQENIADTIRELLEPVSNQAMPMQQHRGYLMGIMNILDELSYQYSLNLEGILLGESEYYETLLAFRNADDLEQWMTKVFQNLGMEIQDRRENSSKAAVREAKEYVQQNYMDPALSVERISQQLHISPSYFSTLFKKETGESYVSYLTNVRLQKAAELLKETDDKTYMVAEQVGYSETNYFSYVFKKKYGVSPTKYRGG